MADVLDAIVIGSGPNGLAAAIVLARAGRKVIVFEAAPTLGGGLRSLPLTLPDFVHDVCSAIHPFAVVSPVFRTLPLSTHGLEWIEPPAMFAHPFDDGTAGVVYRSIDRTAAALGRDGDAYRRLIGPVVADWARLEDSVLGPLRVPRHPVALARFGLKALRSAQGVAHSAFATAPARGLFAGVAAHSMLPLDRLLTGGVGLVLGAMAHVAGWVMPRGGAQSLADALASYLRSLGGEIHTSTVDSIDRPPAAPPARSSPKHIASPGTASAVGTAARAPSIRHGDLQVDWALDAPILAQPWMHAGCHRSSGRIVRRSRAPTRGTAATERPFTLLVQPTLFDPSRAPSGKHTAWAYCHVPLGSTVDMLPRIEQQIERFAPGFRDRILQRHVMLPADVERHNANYVGGDIAAGATDVTQFFNRPTWATYTTPVQGLFICSAATPPGVGVHGMCGYFAAQRALQSVLRS